VSHRRALLRQGLPLGISMLAFSDFCGELRVEAVNPLFFGRHRGH